jgi:hypothetical protein
MSGVALGKEVGANMLVAVAGNQSVVGEAIIVSVGVDVEAISTGAGAQALNSEMQVKIKEMRWIIAAVFYRSWQV